MPQTQDQPGGARPQDVELVDRMLGLFDLVPVEDGLFRVLAVQSKPRRVFGGQLVAQALAAATRTVNPARRVNSLHAYFVRAGVSTSPVDFTVTADADGGSISFRRVLVTQDGRTLLNLSTAFQVAADGLDYQLEPPSPPPPESLEADHAQAARMGELPPASASTANRASSFEFRSLELTQRLKGGAGPARQSFWFRAARPLIGAERDQGLQRIILTYASDMMLVGAGLLPHGLRWFDGKAQVASLDHALWIHGDVAMDDWLFFDQASPWTGQGRGLNFGHIFDRAGRLIATIAQEGSIRRAPVKVEG